MSDQHDITKRRRYWCWLWWWWCWRGVTDHSSFSRIIVEWWWASAAWQVRPWVREAWHGTCYSCCLRRRMMGRSESLQHYSTRPKPGTPIHVNVRSISHQFSYFAVDGCGGSDFFQTITWVIHVRTSSTQTSFSLITSLNHMKIFYLHKNSLAYCRPKIPHRLCSDITRNAIPSLGKMAHSRYLADFRLLWVWMHDAWGIYWRSSPWWTFYDT